MFIAAFSKTKTRNLLIDRLALWINETSTGSFFHLAGMLIGIDRPFTDLYDTGGTGGYPGATFINRPVVGGHFAMLALEKARTLRRERRGLLKEAQLPFH